MNNSKKVILKIIVKCISSIIGSQAFGINVGTPAYLSKDLLLSGSTIPADNAPLVCEANCLFNICGFNVPLFVDYMNNKEGKATSTGKEITGLIKSNAIVCGIRPSKIFGIECDNQGSRCSSRLILDCNKVEGGLELGHE